MSIFAVIKTGGKQYLVSPGQKIKIEKLDGDKNAPILFDKVFLVAEDEKVSVGTPTVSDANIEGTIINQGRNKKVIVFKYHNKTRRRKKKGHRQPFTEVEIGKIAL